MRAFQTFFFILIIIFQGFSQSQKVLNPAKGSLINKTEVVNGISTMHYSKDQKARIKGSPYLDEEFKDGIITLKDGKRIENIKSRYNAYAKQMEIIYDNDTLYLSQPFKINTITCNDEVFSFYVYKNSRKAYEHAYFTVLSDGNFKLLKKKIKTIKTDTYVSNYMAGGGTGDMYYNLESYYYFKNGDELVDKLLTRRKTVLNLMPKHKEEILKYVKQNKLSFNKDEDIIKIFDYLNEVYEAGDKKKS